jgi:F420-dependent oxidoreductase-like protein
MMQFGVFVPQGWKRDLNELHGPVAQYEAMTDVARAADSEPAIDSIWVYDHFHTIPTPELEATFECWTATATLARDTTRVKVGQMVGCMGYRQPALYAKIASTVDVASHGRLYAGIGAGWYEHEWRAYGYEWVETKERMRRFREGVEIIHAMWTADYPTYAGRHYHIDGPINEPKSARPGTKIPLWIGGGGEQVTLKLVAQYGDASNFGGDDETIRRKLDILRGHCESAGRNYDEITKSAQFRIHLIEPGADPEQATAATRGDFIPFERYQNDYIIGTEDDLRREVERLIGCGIDYVIIVIARAGYEPELVRHVGGIVQAYT